jgi:tRNA (mo5U34)-methyltransferase
MLQPKRHCSPKIFALNKKQRTSENERFDAEHKMTSGFPRLASDYYWWHSIDLGNGIVTPGHKTLAIEAAESAAFFDRVDLRKRSVLDIGAWNGFYSFEAKRRGAARVLATDSVCWTDSKLRGREGFELARQALKTDVEALEIDVSDISPDTTGSFDVVLFLGVFYHRYDPIEALACAASVTKQLLIVESHIDLNTLDRPAMVFYPGNELLNDPTNWWGPNLLLFEELLLGHGFSEIEIAFHPHTEKRAVIHAWRTTEMRRSPLSEQKKWKPEVGTTKSRSFLRIFK